MLNMGSYLHLAAIIHKQTKSEYMHGIQNKNSKDVSNVKDPPQSRLFRSITGLRVHSSVKRLFS